ncbi:MAG: DUF1501 domain-containing protein, partial [Bryobacterales bacterium]|nr:DUF1501 domain-containing protein [Bryobacterales bacterium]
MISRRWFLRDCPVGLGALATHHLLGAAIDPTAPKQPHFAPKAKRVVYLFMAGAPSQLELFDHKPQLAKFDGSLPPADLLKGYRAAFINPNSKLMGPKFGFKHYGQSGAYLGELIPHIGSIADDLTIVKSMVTDAFNHAPGQLLINTGSQQFGRPSFGAWTIYGLGAETRDLPAFVVFSSGQKGPSGGNSCWGSGFLPTVYQGVQFRSSGDPVLYLSNPEGVDDRLQRETLDSLRRMNELRLEATGDPEIETRISSFEMAYRMQSSGPELMDVSKEPKHILEMYGAEPGKPSFANNCLLARRLLERGVRFVQLYHEAWDQHGALKKDLARNCKDCDQASAALVKDLKQRGMLEDTIVIWGGEFGRTPMVQGDGEPDGRDHHPNAFTMWMAGGGLKPGLMMGETD